jgi:cytochrome c553
MHPAPIVALLAALAAPPAMAQQAAPPPPSFAPANLTKGGVRSLAATCAACHGTNGKAAAQSAVPGLAGRPRDELAQMLAQFKAGQRSATLMHQIAKGLSDDEVAALSEYFSAQPR